VFDADHPVTGSIFHAAQQAVVNTFLGTQNRDIDGAEVIWDFFRRFAKP